MERNLRDCREDDYKTLKSGDRSTSGSRRVEERRATTIPTSIVVCVSSQMENRPHLLDLNEDIFREIFRYLDDDEVYFTIRNVCQQLKYYVDMYLELVFAKQNVMFARKKVF